MDEYKLTNPLGPTERLSLIRLQRHDTKTSHTVVLYASSILQELSKPDAIGDAEEKWARARDKINLLSTHPENIYQTQETISILARDKITLYPDGQTFFTNRKLIKQLKVLRDLFHDKIEIILPNDKQIPPFLSPIPVTYSVSNNLAKNAIAAQDIINPKEKPRLTLEMTEGIPANTLYIPIGAENYTQFVRFRVQNQGEFPKDRALIERLAGSIPPQGARGYGLRFVGMAAKALRAPVHIETGNGQTLVDFYHPIYTTDRRLK